MASGAFSGLTSLTLPHIQVTVIGQFDPSQKSRHKM